MSTHKTLIRYCSEIEWLLILVLCIVTLFIEIAKAQTPGRLGHIIEGSGRYQPDPSVLSAPTLEAPIYGCTQSVIVDSVAPAAEEIRVFAKTPLPQGGLGPEQLIGVQKSPGNTASGGSNSVFMNTTPPFTTNQVVYAVQVRGGVTSGPSNTVTVRDLRDDYPSGLPIPRVRHVDPHPCLECGQAVAVDNVIPGAWYKVFADSVEIGHGTGNQWTTTPPMELGKHISVQSGIIQSSTCPVQPVASVESELVQKDPDPVSVPPLVPGQAYSGTDGDQFVIVPQTLTKTSLGQLGVLRGAQVNVLAGGVSLPPHSVGSTPSPGPSQAVRITPLSPAQKFAQAQQTLCQPYPVGPQTPVKSCSELPAATIGTPMRGDTVVQALDYMPGSEIEIFVTNPRRTPSTKEIGDEGPPVIRLTEPIMDGDEVAVVQRVGNCTSNLVYVVDATSSMDVLTQHNDNGRTGHYTEEHILMPDVVRGPTFHRLSPSGWQLDPDDGANQIYAQPLYMHGLQVNGFGQRNVVFVATESNSIYAFDADDGSKFWKLQLPAPVDLSQTPQLMPNGGYLVIYPKQGITSTPVIDPGTNRLFAVAIVNLPGAGQVADFLYAIDISSGQVVGNPKPIQGSVPGSGGGAQNGVLRFDPARHRNRASLLLQGGKIYVAFSGAFEDFPYHGWVFAYRGDTLDQIGVYATNPDGVGAGIWQSGNGLAGDGYAVYFTTGNGGNFFNGQSFDHNPQGSNLIKLGPSLEQLDWFRPSNQQCLDTCDLDLTRFMHERSTRANRRC
jgi:outer membrane protein assembly factor BamB